MSSHYVDIIDHETSETIKSLGPYDSNRTAEKADRGLNYQIDHSRYYTQIREENNA